MSPFVFLTLFTLIFIAFAVITKKGFFSITPKQEWKDILNEFDNNVKAINNIDISDYKIGSGHLYETRID